MAPDRTLGLCLLTSGLIHLGLLGLGGVESQRPGMPEPERLSVVLRPLSQQGRSLEPAWTLPDAGHKSRAYAARTGSGMVVPGPTARPDANLGQVQRAPRDDDRVPLSGFDPALYLTPYQVERGLVPVNPDLLDTLPLTGFESGLWQVRLFVDETGKVDEVEMVEEQGSRRNAEELKAILAASRFLPALSNTVPVKSQTIIEISFEPVAQSRIFLPDPTPWAAER